MPEAATLPHLLKLLHHENLIRKALEFIEHPDFPVFPHQPGTDAVEHLEHTLKQVLRERFPNSKHQHVTFEFTEETNPTLAFHFTSDQALWCSVGSSHAKYRQHDRRIIPSLMRHLQQNSYYAGLVYTPENAAEHLSMREDDEDIAYRTTEAREHLAEKRGVAPEAISNSEVEAYLETEFMTSSILKKRFPEWFEKSLPLSKIAKMLPEDPTIQAAVTALQQLRKCHAVLQRHCRLHQLTLPSLEEWHCHSYVFCISHTAQIGYSNIFYEMFAEETYHWGDGICAYFVGEYGPGGINHALKLLDVLEEARTLQIQVLELLTEDTEWEEHRASHI